MSRETPGDWVEKAAKRGLSPQEMVQLYHLAALAKKEDAKATLWSIAVVAAVVLAVVLSAAAVVAGATVLWR